MRVAPDKRSAVRGNEEIIFPSFHGPPRQPAGWRGGPWKEGLLLLLAGFPGRQSLRSFALGYFFLAPTGQIEPSHWESALKARPQGAALCGAASEPHEPARNASRRRCGNHR